MKKLALLLTLAIMLPAISFAVPAETTGGAISPESYASQKRYLAIKNFLKKRFDSGLRSWEFKPHVYKSRRLQYKNVDYKRKPTFPGIEYRKLCSHWKNCVKRVYKASNGYDQAYKKYEGDTKIAGPKKIDLAFLPNRARKLGARETRSGKYKLLHWNVSRFSH